MLGAPEVGKTHLTNQFMSSSDVGTFNQLTGKLTQLVARIVSYVVLQSSHFCPLLRPSFMSSLDRLSYRVEFTKVKFREASLWRIVELLS